MSSRFGESIPFRTLHGSGSSSPQEEQGSGKKNEKKVLRDAIERILFDEKAAAAYRTAAMQKRQAFVANQEEMNARRSAYINAPNSSPGTTFASQVPLLWGSISSLAGGYLDFFLGRFLGLEK